MTDLIFKEFGIIFPAFGIDYNREDLETAYKIPIDFESYFNKAFPTTLIHFEKAHLSDHFNELNSQFIAYIFSAAIADYLKEKGIKSNYISSYSMGIYAAFYYAGSYDFITGLELIKTAYNFTVEAITGNRFGMAGVIGLEQKDLINFISQKTETVEIVNENNKLSFVIAGYYEEIENFVEILIDEGAINTKVLPIKSCYHTKFNKAASNKFKEYLDGVNINSINKNFISSINQQIISKDTDIKNELCNNLSMKLNWSKTMDKLIMSDVGNFIECGLGKSLFKIGRFIDGSFKIHTLKNIPNIIN